MTKITRGMRGFFLFCFIALCLVSLAEAQSEQAEAIEKIRRQALAESRQDLREQGLEVAEPDKAIGQQLSDFIAQKRSEGLKGEELSKAINTERRRLRMLRKQEQGN